MANILGNYNPTFFANEALIQLYKALGFAGRVHRGLDDERNTTGRQKGDVINIKRPSHFTAAPHVAGVGTTAQDVVGQNVAVTLDNHQEVKFKLSDVELAYSSEQIIADHISPAAYALADKIDQDLHALGDKVGPKTIISTADATAIINPRMALRNNHVPMDANIHYLIDSGMEAAFLNLGIFHQASTTGEGSNEQALMNGTLGRRFGVEVFATQNADVTPDTMADGPADLAASVTNTTDANVGSLLLGDAGAATAFLTGDTFTVAGDPTVYILTGDATSDGSGVVTIEFYPKLRKTAVATSVVTFVDRDAVEQAAHYRNLMFHRNAFALAFAPLPMTGDGKGALIDTVTDPVTGLSVRARMFYNGDTATNFVALDALYGVQVLDGQLATRVLRATSVAPAA